MAENLVSDESTLEVTDTLRRQKMAQMNKDEVRHKDDLVRTAR